MTDRCKICLNRFTQFHSFFALPEVTWTSVGLECSPQNCFLNTALQMQRDPVRIATEWGFTIKVDVSPDEAKPALSHIIRDFQRNGRDSHVDASSVSNMGDAVKKSNLKARYKVIKNECRFCKNNNMPKKCYKNHITSTCPVLLSYTCPICGKNGHTVRYCPQKKIVTLNDIM